MEPFHHTAVKMGQTMLIVVKMEVSKIIQIISLSNFGK
jgi:hypothetical protein